LHDAAAAAATAEQTTTAATAAATATAVVSISEERRPFNTHSLTHRYTSHHLTSPQQPVLVVNAPAPAAHI